jgi:glutaredoxin
MDYPLDEDAIVNLPWEEVLPETPFNKKVNVFYLMLTTCAYCKKGKKWLDEKNVAYKWLYLDNLPTDQKIPLKEWIKKKYKTNMGLPFIIFRSPNSEYFSDGYDPDYWKAKIH